MTSRSVAKSVTASEDGMRGQSSGGSAVATLDFAGIWLRIAEWNDKYVTGMGVEHGVTTQDFGVPVIKVEGVMGSYDHWEDPSSEVSVVVKSDIVEILTDVRRVSDGKRVCPWGRGRFGWRGSRSLRFEIYVRRSQGRDNGSRSRMILFHISWFWFPSHKCSSQAPVMQIPPESSCWSDCRLPLGGIHTCTCWSLSEPGF